MARRGRASQGWARIDEAHSFEEAAQDLPKRAWKKVTRRFRDGHTEVWWAAELKFLGYGPDRARRAVVATTDPSTRPAISTWYLSTNMTLADAPLAEVVRLYGLRNWIEDHYKRVKDELGWADFMVRSDHAIRRHWTLVNCAFSFCWWHEAQQPAPQETAAPASAKAASTCLTANNAPSKAREKNQPAAATGLLAAGAAACARLAGAMEVARHLLAGLEQQAPASRTRGTAQRRHRGQWTPAVSA